MASSLVELMAASQVAHDKTVVSGSVPQEHQHALSVSRCLLGETASGSCVGAGEWRSCQRKACLSYCLLDYNLCTPSYVLGRVPTMRLTRSLSKMVCPTPLRCIFISWIFLRYSCTELPSGNLKEFNLSSNMRRDALFTFSNRSLSMFQATRGSVTSASVLKMSSLHDIAIENKALAWRCATSSGSTGTDWLLLLGSVYFQVFSFIIKRSLHLTF